MKTFVLKLKGVHLTEKNIYIVNATDEQILFYILRCKTSDDENLNDIHIPSRS